MAATIQPLTISSASATAPALRPAAGDVATLAAAIESGNVDQLASMITPRCWFEVRSEDAGPIGRSVTGYLADLRSRFRRGLHVRVISSVLAADLPGPNGIRSYIQSEWSESGRASRVDLFLSQAAGRWYWSGIRQYAPGP